jgi:hypothetical protein
MGAVHYRRKGWGGDQSISQKRRYIKKKKNSQVQREYPNRRTGEESIVIVIQAVRQA